MNKPSESIVRLDLRRNILTKVLHEDITKSGILLREREAAREEEEEKH